MAVCYLPHIDGGLRFREGWPLVLVPPAGKRQSGVRHLGVTPVFRAKPQDPKQ